MTVTLRNAKDDPADANWLRNVFPFYLHELSSLGAAFWSLDEAGLWQPAERVLNDFLTRPDADPLLVIDGEGKRVGFALVAHHPFPHMGADADHHVAEFFILGTYRRLGLGREAAEAILRRWPGRWDMYVLNLNQPARRFWREIVGDRPGFRTEPDGNAERFVFDVTA